MHLIKFKGRNYSGSVIQNLLWRDKNVYLMDNHRAALWCWQQELDLYTENHCILHIDRHTDCLGANLECHLKAMPDLRELRIEEYLEADLDLHLGKAELFRWDNYLSIHLAAFGNTLKGLRSLDHDDGDNPEFEPTIRSRCDELPQNTLYWLQQGNDPWIVNVDLDYFFTDGPNFQNKDDGEYVRMFSDAYIACLFDQVRKAIDEGHVKVVTICLTPTNFTSGWSECLEISEKIFTILGAKHPNI